MDHTSFYGVCECVSSPGAFVIIVMAVALSSS